MVGHSGMFTIWRSACTFHANNNGVVVLRTLALSNRTIEPQDKEFLWKVLVRTVGSGVSSYHVLMYRWDRMQRFNRRNERKWENKSDASKHDHFSSQSTNIYMIRSLANAIHFKLCLFCFFELDEIILRFNADFTGLLMTTSNGWHRAVAFSGRQNDTIPFTKLARCKKLEYRSLSTHYRCPYRC